MAENVRFGSGGKLSPSGSRLLGSGSQFVKELVVHTAALNLQIFTLPELVIFVYDPPIWKG